MKRPLSLAAWLAIQGAFACAPTAVTPPKTPTTGPTAPAATTERTTTKPVEPTLATRNIIAEAPASCNAYVSTGPVNCPIVVATSGAREPLTALNALDAAFAEKEPLSRNQKLVALESCSDFEPGLIVALRADLAPPECADRIVEPLLADNKTTLNLELSQLLRGQSIGARLLRAEVAPPVPHPPFTKEHFDAFLKEQIRPWYGAQSQAIYGLAAEGAKLSGYGKAITAVEAGLSDLRFVENVRKVPLPEEMNRDPELVEAYAQGLEDALEPRKARGRDAILVGLLHLGQQGILHDGRLYRARAQLTRLFAGSRVDALDGLILPELPAVGTSTVVERLATQLPPFFSDRLLTTEQAESPTVLRALLERGLPPKLRQHVERRAYEDATIARLYARALLELGSRYFRPADFTRATIILGTKGTLTGPAAKETRLIAALAHALDGGPENAVQLMLTGPMLPDSMGKIDQLERLAKEPGVLGGLSAYDAAHLMTIIPQREPHAEHWEKAAQLFDDAARKLTQPKQKELAKARAEDARATAVQIRSNAKSTPVAATNARPPTAVN
jgi:hypothetical protein